MHVVGMHFYNVVTIIHHGNPNHKTFIYPTEILKSFDVYIYENHPYKLIHSINIDLEINIDPVVHGFESQNKLSVLI